MSEDDSNDISSRRAKTAWQLKRNSNLKKAADAIKNHSSLRGQSVKIEWKFDDEKRRFVKAGEKEFFIQSECEVAGKIAALFDDLTKICLARLCLYEGALRMATRDDSCPPVAPEARQGTQSI